MKNKKRNHRKYNSFDYTAGRNMFGEKAETHFIVLKKETALAQMLDAVCQFDGSTKEFTFDMTCFNDSPAELEEIFAKVEAFMMFKVSLTRKPYLNVA